MGVQLRAGVRPAAYAFGPFRVDLLTRQLFNRGMATALTPKAFDLLVALIDGRPGAIAKDDLMRRLWPDTSVEEGNLTQQVFVLRRILGRQPDGQPYIETVARHGYRFSAAVREMVDPVHTDHPTDTDVAPVRSRAIPRWPALTGAALVLVVALASSVLWVRARTGSSVPSAPSTIRLAVLPFENFSGDASREYVADGLTEETISRLARLQPETLKIIARTSSMHYKTGRPSMSQIARELQVDYVLEGSIREVGGRVRITAQLIQTGEQTQMWAETFERDRDAVLDVDIDIARHIATTLSIRPLPEQQAGLNHGSTTSAAAHEDYLKGLFHWNKRSEAGFKKSIEHFESAAREDSRFALAFVGLANAFALLGAGNYSAIHPLAARAKARTAVDQALALDPALAEAHAALGLVFMLYDWDWPQADREYRRAIELNAGYAIVHDWYAYNLSLMEQHDRALAEIEIARALDPVSIAINRDVGTMYLLARQYDRAVEWYRRALELDPSAAVAHWQLGLTVEGQQHFDVAIAEFRAAVDLANDNPVYLAALGHAYAKSGLRSEAREILDALDRLAKKRYVTSKGVAAVHTALDQRDLAFKALEQALHEREEGLPYIKLDWRFDALRADPRFGKLMRRVGVSD